MSHLMIRQSQRKSGSAGLNTSCGVSHLDGCSRKTRTVGLDAVFQALRVRELNLVGQCMLTAGASHESAVIRKAQCKNLLPIREKMQIFDTDSKYLLEFGCFCENRKQLFALCQKTSPCYRSVTHHALIPVYIIWKIHAQFD